jgi:hypothetical protein
MCYTQFLNLLKYLTTFYLVHEINENIIVHDYQA